MSRFGLSVFFAAVLAALFSSSSGQRFERATGLGLLYTLRGVVAAPPEAIVIALDQESVSWLNRNVASLAENGGLLSSCATPHAVGVLSRARNINTIPRALYICLLDEIAGRSPELIVFDISFNADKPDDQAFAEALARSGRSILLESQRLGEDGAFRQLSPAAPLVAASLGTVVFQVNGSGSEVTTAFATRASVTPDLDAMPVAVWKRYNSNAPGAESLPKMQPIWFYGPPGTIETYSLRAALERGSMRSLPANLTGKVVFIGASDPGNPAASDHFLMPSFFDEADRIGGVEIAATAF